MQMLYCWRCKREMPMLDEAEYEQVTRIGRLSFEQIKAYRESHAVTIAETPVDMFFEPMLVEYKRITGFHETNPRAIWHHRISIYGPPCRRCGKVLPGPKSSKCFECGEPRNA